MEVGDVIKTENPIQAIDISMPLNDAWEQFGDGGDKIKGLSFSEAANGTVVQYSAQPNAIFDWHTHESVESCIVYGDLDVFYGEILADGSVKVTEKHSIKDFGMIMIPKEKPHYFKFKTHCELMIGWYPKFIGKDWGATFLNPTQESKDDYKVLDALTLGAQKLFE